MHAIGKFALATEDNDGAGEDSLSRSSDCDTDIIISDTDIGDTNINDADSSDTDSSDCDESDDTCSADISDDIDLSDNFQSE